MKNEAPNSGPYELFSPPVSLFTLLGLKPKNNELVILTLRGSIGLGFYLIRIIWDIRGSLYNFFFFLGH